MYRALLPGAIGLKVPFAEAARLAEKYGFQGIGLGMGELKEPGLAEVRRLLQDHHLVPALSWIPVNFRQDEATFERDLAELPAFCQLMADLGCTRLATWLTPWHGTLPYQAHFAQLRERTARICEVLARYGLRYGLEFVGPETSWAGKPYPFIHDLAGLLELIRAVGAENLGVLLDSWHWYTSGGTAEDLAQLSDDLVVAVHVNDAPAGIPREQQIDSVRAMPGETGVIDIATFLRALDHMAYSGPIVVEPFCAWLKELAPEEAVAATAKSLDKIWALAGL